MKKRKEWKERHVYYFECQGPCGSRRYSFYRARANRGICRKCRKAIADKNQMKMFEGGEQA